MNTYQQKLNFRPPLIFFQLVILTGYLSGMWGLRKNRAWNLLEKERRKKKTNGA
jgi:hypothetical protein